METLYSQNSLCENCELQVLLIIRCNKDTTSLIEVSGLHAGSCLKLSIKRKSERKKQETEQDKQTLVKLMSVKVKETETG